MTSLQMWMPARTVEGPTARLERTQTRYTGPAHPGLSPSALNDNASMGKNVQYYLPNKKSSATTSRTLQLCLRFELGTTQYKTPFVISTYSPEPNTQTHQNSTNDSAESSE
ncbi:hypothetical protein Sjap_010047 [Stephania japonica]|uniref:Uncharacterized protein n=1 Tax=Stephania japonica TaxID=461633 RepID=A0AAP0J9N6_9MAGN